jgi:hypothetical protein
MPEVVFREKIYDGRPWGDEEVRVSVERMGSYIEIGVEGDICCTIDRDAVEDYIAALRKAAERCDEIEAEVAAGMGEGGMR